MLPLSLFLNSFFFYATCRRPERWVEVGQLFRIIRWGSFVFGASGFCCFSDVETKKRNSVFLSDSFLIFFPPFAFRERRVVGRRRRTTTGRTLPSSPMLKNKRRKKKRRKKKEKTCHLSSFFSDHFLLVLFRFQPYRWEQWMAKRLIPMKLVTDNVPYCSRTKRIKHEGGETVKPRKCWKVGTVHRTTNRSLKKGKVGERVKAQKSDATSRLHDPNCWRIPNINNRRSAS